MSDSMSLPQAWSPSIGMPPASRTRQPAGAVRARPVTGLLLNGQRHIVERGIGHGARVEQSAQPDPHLPGAERDSPGSSHLDPPGGADVLEWRRYRAEQPAVRVEKLGHHRA